MFDHFQGFKKICDSRSVTQQEFIKDNISCYPIFEKILGYQYEINQSISAIYNEKHTLKNCDNPGIIQQMLMKSSVFNLCAYNIEYLSQAMTSLEHNNLHVFADIIRPVYESIPKMFYMLHHPEEIELVIAKELFKPWSSRKKYDCFMSNISISKAELITMFVQENSQTLSKFDNRVIEELLKGRDDKFSNAWYRKQVYSDKFLKLQDYEYGILSASTHANIFRSHDYEKYDKKQNKIFMIMLRDLSFFNLYIQFNACHEALDKIQEKMDTCKFIINVQQELKSHIQVTHLYPTHSEYKQKLILYPL